MKWPSYKRVRVEHGFGVAFIGAMNLGCALGWVLRESAGMDTVAYAPLWFVVNAGVGLWVLTR